MIHQTFALTLCLSLLTVSPPREEPKGLPGTTLLAWQDDLSARMVAGIDRFLMRKIEQSVNLRPNYWSRDVSSSSSYEASVAPNRQRLQKVLGIADKRLDIQLERFGSEEDSPLVAEAADYRVWQVRWPVLDGVWGEGLLLEPRSLAQIHIVALPDADQTPEQLVGLADGIASESQFARRLAESGCQVLVPTLISRQNDFSGNPNLYTNRLRMTNMPHREWLYRMSYQMGRHLIGYEVQKVLAAVDWFRKRYREPVKIGVAGYGEGGLIALYSAAVDTRIDTCLVSGYFGPREGVWKEPIYRNVWTLLHEFGDAEIASLILPRGLVVEHSLVPEVIGPPPAHEGQREVAAPGEITTATEEVVRREFDRLVQWHKELHSESRMPKLIVGDGKFGTVRFGSNEALGQLLSFLVPNGSGLSTNGQPPRDLRKHFDAQERQLRQIRQIENHVQHLLRISRNIRDQFFLDQMPSGSARDFAQAAQNHRKLFWEEVIGKIPDPLLPPNPRTRKIYDRAKWTGYEVVLDAWPDVFAWGILLLPKDLRPGEKRPVVVAQHGGEGVPADVIETERSGYRAYRAFASQLADRGFIVYAPHNPYRGDKFRALQFKANPLKLSLFSFIVGQHQQLLNWLKTLPFVDGDRIGFYGLSYGGKTAMRIPAILEDYALSICSGDFNEWVWKIVTTDFPNSYMFTKEYEMYEFNLGMTFNYAEMAYLIFPRPFMVERGHRDGVGLDDWVAYEYAKVRRLYDELGKGDKTEIEFFNGGHEIHGAGTFEFLHKHLNWPGP